MLRFTAIKYNIFNDLEKYGVLSCWVHHLLSRKAAMIPNVSGGV